MRKKPSIAFISPANPCDKKRRWSGVPYYMMKSIQDYWGNIEAFYWEKSRLLDLIIRLITITSKVLFKKDFLYMKSIFCSKIIG